MLRTEAHTVSIGFLFQVIYSSLCLGISDSADSGVDEFPVSSDAAEEVELELELEELLTGLGALGCFFEVRRRTYHFSSCQVFETYGRL